MKSLHPSTASFAFLVLLVGFLGCFSGVLTVNVMGRGHTHRVWRPEADMKSMSDAIHLFRLDVEEIVLTSIGVPPDHIVVEFWTPARGYRRLERR